jgi:hypothetical protein
VALLAAIGRASSLTRAGSPASAICEC